MRRHSWIGGLALLPALAWAEPSPEHQALLDRAQSREKALGEQKAHAESMAREQAFLAYRLSRRQQLGYVGRPDGRAADAQVLDAAIVALQRAASETQALDAELQRVRADRIQLMGALSDTPEPDPSAPNWEPATGSQTLPRWFAAGQAGRLPTRPNWESATGSHDPRVGKPVRFSRPVRGEIVSAPGPRHDADTDTTLSFQGVDVLTRLNEPVRAPADGLVRRVESLPQGGFAVVTSHPDGWVSILSGMRDVAVSAGAAVSAGQPLGRAGRNVDGAAVITVELWYRRHPVDPRTMVRGLRR